MGMGVALWLLVLKPVGPFSLFLNSRNEGVFIVLRGIE